MKKKTWIIIFVVIVIIIGLLLFMAFKKPTQKQKNAKGEMCPDGKTPVPSDGNCPKESVDNPKPDPTTGCVQPSGYSNYQFPLKKGMMDWKKPEANADITEQGRAIALLQHKLNIGYLLALKEDGIFGCNTENAVKEKLGVTEIYTTNPIWAIAEPILG